MGFAAGRRGALLDAAVAAAGLLYAALLAVLSFGYTFEARVFAQVAAAVGIVTAAVYLVASVREYRATAPDAPQTEREGAERRGVWRRLLFVAALILGSTVVLYLLGVYAFGFAFAVAFLRFFAGHSWRTTLQLAIGLTAFDYVMFAMVFDLTFDAVGVLLQ